MLVNPKMKEGFEIIELDSTANEKQIRGLVTVGREAWEGMPAHYLRFQGLSEDQKNYYTRKFTVEQQLNDHRYRTFVVRDLKTDEFVGWTHLQCPGTQTEAEKQHEKSENAASLDALAPEGAAYVRMLQMTFFPLAQKYGYDPEKCFHKRFTVIRPEYQRHGLGTWLTEYCNAIADNASKPTFVFAIRTLWKVFERTGFEVLEQNRASSNPIKRTGPDHLKYGGSVVTPVNQIIEL